MLAGCFLVCAGEPSNQPYLDSTHKLIFGVSRSRIFSLTTESALRSDCSRISGLFVWSAGLRAMMESRARGANR